MTSVFVTKYGNSVDWATAMEVTLQLSSSSSIVNLDNSGIA